MKGVFTMKQTAKAEYKYLPDGKVEVTFINIISGEMNKKIYKTQAAADAQVTKFFKKLQYTV